MPFSMGPFEMLFLLIVTVAAWAIPIAVLLWFIRSINDIRDSIRRIEQRLERSE